MTVSNDNAFEGIKSIDCGTVYLTCVGDGIQDRFYEISVNPCTEKDTYAVVVAFGDIGSLAKRVVVLSEANFQECIEAKDRRERLKLKQGFTRQGIGPTFMGFVEWDGWDEQSQDQETLLVDKPKVPVNMYALLGGDCAGAPDDWI